MGPDETLRNLIKAIKAKVDQLTFTSDKLKTDAVFTGTAIANPTFKDDPADTNEAAKFGKRNASTLKPQVEADVSGTVLDNILAALDTVETKLQAISDNTDGLEGFVDGIETLLTAIRDYVDTLETKLTDVSTATHQATHTTRLTEIRDFVDTLELNVNARPSQKANRTHKRASIRVVTANTTIYTVTAGKTFYLTDLIITVRNTNVTTGGGMEHRR